MWKNARHDAKIPSCRAFAQIAPAEDELLEQVNRPSGDVLTGRIASTEDVGIIPTPRSKKETGHSLVWEARLSSRYYAMRRKAPVRETLPVRSACASSSSVYVLLRCVASSMASPRRCLTAYMVRTILRK